MSAAGWVVAMGATVLANEIATTEAEVNWFKIPVATAALAIAVDAAEKAPAFAYYTKWIVGIAFVTVVLAPLGGRPSPVQTVDKFIRSFQ